MYVQRFLCGNASDQRVFLQLGDGRVQLERVAGQFLQRWRELRGSLSEKHFGDVVGSEEGAEAQEVGGGGIGLPDTLKRELPGGGDRFGMIIEQAAASAQEVGMVRVVEI